MSPTDSREPGPTVAVIGAGMAGMAAAVAAAQNGLRVELFEASPALGGRVGSFRNPDGPFQIDFCQHVAMGCCTNLADFCRRVGVDACFQRQRRIDFIGPTGNRHTLAAMPLPAPLHLAPSLARLKYLSWSDRRRIGRTLLRLARLRPSIDTLQTIGDWLRDQGESDTAMARFWSLVLESALSDLVDRLSLAAAQKVLVDGFLASRRAYEMVVPRESLAEIFDRRAADRLVEQNVVIHRGAKIVQIEGDARQARHIVLADGRKCPFNFFVAAVSWWQVKKLLARPLFDALPGLEGIDRIESAPITAVHLWLDRPVTSLSNAALVGRRSQWIFHPAWTVNPQEPEPRNFEPREADDQGHYSQVVVSASHELLSRGHEAIAEEVFRELQAIWPAAREAKRLRARVFTNPKAVFSMSPGIESLRPKQATPVPNFMLAGDWTDTLWPATMEGAVRSGYLAVEAILKHLGRPRSLLVPDLPRGLLWRLLDSSGLLTLQQLILVAGFAGIQ